MAARTGRVLALPIMPQRLDAERLELALKGADLALWDVDFSTGRTVVNARWYEMLGLPPRQDQGDASEWADRIHPDDRDRVLAAEAAHRQGLTPSFEATYRLHHADGHWIWVLDRGRVLQRDALGRALRMCGTHLDITDRMLAEEALRRSEQDMQVTLQSIGDAVITTDARGRVSRMNPSAERMTAWQERDALGRPLAEVFRIVDDPTGRPVADPVMQVLARGETVGLSNDTRLIARDGRERQIADSAAPIRRADGEIIGVVLVFSDVSGAYRVQRALRERERELALVVAQMPGLVSRVDLEGRYQYASPGYERWFGRPLTDIVGRTQRELLGEARHAELAGLIDRARAGEVVRYESHVRTLHGERYVLGTLVPDLDDDGQVRGHFTFVTDISERKRTEEALQSVQRQLLQAQKLEALGTLAGGIAHDFNNVLAAILGNARLAQEDAQDSPLVLQSLGEITKAGQRARDMVQRILSFSRSQTLQRRVVALADVVEESVNLLRATIPRGVVLDVTCAPDTPLLLGDPTQLHQVLMNLCTNAWQAMPDRSKGRLTIRLAPHAGPPPRDADLRLDAGVPDDAWPAVNLCLTVGDDGCGMDADTLARLFEPFFTTKAPGEGTGLGLAVVHGILRDHQAAVRVHSVPGEGTTFSLYFRAADSQHADTGSTLGPDSQPWQPSGPHAITVLYVDDDPLIVDLMRRLLQRAGYQAFVFSEPRAALEAVQSGQVGYDLAITDFSMPGMDGLALARALRDARPGREVAITSGYISAELRRDAAAAGITELIDKPNTGDELLAAIDRLARRRRYRTPPKNGSGR